MKYRKKPVVIEAFKYDGDLINSDGSPLAPSWALAAWEDSVLFYDTKDPQGKPPCELFVKTLEGNMHVSVGDFIIRGIKDEIYPCKPDIFEATYEKVEEGELTNELLTNN